VSVELYV